MVQFSNKADARPAVGLHGVEVLETVQVGNHVGASLFNSLLADWVSSSDVIYTLDLFGLWAGVIFEGEGECEEAEY